MADAFGALERAISRAFGVTEISLRSMFMAFEDLFLHASCSAPGMGLRLLAGADLSAIFRWLMEIPDPVEGNGCQIRVVHCGYGI